MIVAIDTLIMRPSYLADVLRRCRFIISIVSIAIRHRTIPAAPESLIILGPWADGSYPGLSYRGPTE